MDIHWVTGLLTGLALIVASAVKWNLPAKKVSVMMLISIGITAGVLYPMRQSGWPAYMLNLIIPVILCGNYIGCILFLFYRDPDRIPPLDPDAVLSPADGKIIYIKPISNGIVPAAIKKGKLSLLDELSGTTLDFVPMWQIGIALMFTDVHVNRAPISGRVIKLYHRPGRFLSLRKPEALDVNERQTVVIGNERITIALVQIASRLVRRIESYVHEGDKIPAGSRIGMIKFGSQVDLFIPQAKVTDMVVGEGASLYAGQTVICRLRPNSGKSQKKETQ